MRELLIIFSLVVVLFPTSAVASHVCRYDENCMRGKVCVRGKCRPLSFREFEKCERDEDCKGEDLCFEGKCGRITNKAPRKDENRFYFDLLAGMSFPVWGQFKYKATFRPISASLGEGDFSPPLAGGVRIAPFFVSNRYVHLGIYYKMRGGSGSIKSKSTEESAWVPHKDPAGMMTIGTGLIIKIRFAPLERVYMGLELEAGFHALKIFSWEDDFSFPFERKYFKGLELAPQFFLDVLSLGKRKFRFSMPIRLGAEFVPRSRLQPYEDAYSLDYDNLYDLNYIMRSISIVASIGLEFGRKKKQVGVSK